MLPTFTTSSPGPQFSSTQLIFAATASIVLYGLFVAILTFRHRDYFLPVTPEGKATPLQGAVHLAVLAAYVVLAVNP